MSRFQFNLATQEDDASLRELLAATPMQGDVQMAFSREPSYFTASAVDGDFVQVVAARDTKSRRIIGMGSRSVSRCYVNGKVMNVGYLSALRLLPEYRGKAAILARGYQFFRELHNDGKANFYLTTIAADNKSAVELLTSRRAGLPTYDSLGRYHTLTLSSEIPQQAEVSIRKATTADAARIVDFLRRVGSTRQFFPDYEPQEFLGSPRRLLGLKPESILLAERDNNLVGTMGVWDQRGHKQCLITGYSNRLRLGRPLYNAISRLRGRPRLPKVGEPINLRYAAVPVVANHDPNVALALVSSAISELHNQRGSFLAMGLHEDDPLLPMIQPYSGREYVTLVYLVYWPDRVPNVEEMANLVPYLELGCL